MNDKRKIQPLTPAALNAMLNGDLENFIAATTKGGIEAQEAAGQKAFVQSELMPIEMIGELADTMFARDALEKLGFEVLGQSDDLFYNVKLPQGWKKERTDHSMWSIIRDEQGRERIAIFYKAAFYDRKAHFSLETRYSGSRLAPVSGYGENYKLNDDRIARVKDQKTTIWESNIIPEAVYAAASYEERREMEKIGQNWLDEHYPDWRSPFAYWDTP